MERRKFVVGLGALASGSAAAMGTGAFSSAQAERSVSVTVADDRSGYIELNKLDDRFVNDEGDALEIAIGDEGDASGANADSIFEFEDLFSIGIAGGVADDDTEFWVGVVPTGFDSLDGERPVRVYANDAEGSPEDNGDYYSLNGDYPAFVEAEAQDQPEEDLIDLTPGESFDVDLQINTAAADAGGELNVVAIEKGGERDNT